MSCHRFYFKLYTPGYEFVAEFDDVVYAEWARQENDIGALQLRLCGCDLGFEPECMMIVEIWHEPPCGGSVKLDGDTIWFLQKWTRSWSGGGQCIDLFFNDAIWLLSRRIVAWFATEGPQSPGHLQKDLGEMVTSIARYNFGEWVCNYNGDPDVTVAGVVPLAAGGPGTLLGIDCTKRKMAIGVSNAVTAGVVATHEMSWANLLDSMKAIAEDSAAQGVPLIFDVVVSPTTKALNFKTWIKQRGQDRSSEVTFSPANENVGDGFEETVECSTAGWAYVGGGDAGAGDRLVQGVIDYPNAFSELWGAAETFVDGGDVVEEAALAAIGRAELYRQSARVTHAGRAIDAEGATWGCDYGYGDRVGVFGSFYSDARITSYRINLQGNSVEIDVPFETDRQIGPTKTSGV